MTAYRPREMAGVLEKALKDMPVVVLTGMRQAGKSTLLQRHPPFRHRRYVSMDDLGTLDLARGDPSGFIRGEAPMTIDEAQRCPDLLLAIKRSVDERRHPGRFLLSGSANFALLRRITESLAGRAIYYELHPFSLREAGRRPSRTPYLKSLFDAGRPPGEGASRRQVSWRDVMLGGLPMARLELARNPARWFAGYIQTYLERDLRDLSNVADLIDFRRVIRLAALRSGQLLRVSELARDARLNVMTVSRYLNLLETSYVARTIGPSLANRASRLIKMPKFYIADSGLACHLTGLDRSATAGESPLAGAMFETWAAQQLSALVAAHWEEAELAYWNVQGRHEVDFVLEVGRNVVAIEVKMSSRWGEGDIRGLRAFLSQTPNCRAAVLAHNGTAVGRLADRLWAVPLGLLLS